MRGEIAPEITPVMVSAGLRVYEDLQETFPGYLLVGEIYKAMVLADRSERSRAKGGKGRSVVPNACSND